MFDNCGPPLSPSFLSSRLMAPRKRAALRLLNFVVTYSVAVSVLAYLAGVAGLLYAPFLARNTYTDENALLIGSAAPGFGEEQAREAALYAEAAAALAEEALQRGADPHEALGDWVLRELRASGLAAEAHSFAVAPRRQRGSTLRSRGRSVVSVARAGRGDSKEALVLVTPLGPQSALALGVALALLRHLSHAGWLARDLLWLAADEGCAGGAHAAAEAWLAEYQGLGGLDGAAPQPPWRFLRGGALSAALVVDAPGGGFDALQLRVQGRQGALPNLDLVSLAHSTAAAPLALAGDAPGALQGGGTADWAQYAASLRAAARFLARQAAGEPDGVHGAFLDAWVEAATVQAVRTPGSPVSLHGDLAALRLGRMLEGSFRSLSNVLERLHHNSAFYILLSPARLLSPPAYMPQLGLLMAGPLLCACALATRGAGARWPGAPALGDWAHAAAAAVGVIVAGAGAQAALLALPRGDAGEGCDWHLFAWGACVATACAVGLRAPTLLLSNARPLRDGPWVPLKSLALISTCIWVARAMVVSYGLALPSALLLAPACLAARPSDSQRRTLRSHAARLLRWALLAAASPPAVLALAAAGLGCRPQQVFWRLAAHTEEWDTLLLPFLCGAYLPCFVLCAAVTAA